jgi:predicted RNA-binding Zn-ribbon protein involved in translation (DUF1610 family)
MAVFKRRLLIMESDRSLLKYKSISPSNKSSKSRQLWLLENHPSFTGKCNNCGYDYGNYKVLDIDEKSSHWNCPECGMNHD